MRETAFAVIDPIFYGAPADPIDPKARTGICGKQPLPALDAGALADWLAQTRAARARLLAQDTLGDSLLKFVAKNR
jgi:hypothetical protein